MDKIVTVYNEIKNQETSLSIAVVVVKSLSIVLESSVSTTMTEFIQLLRNLIAHLQANVSNPVAVKAGIFYLLRLRPLSSLSYSNSIVR